MCLWTILCTGRSWGGSLVVPCLKKKERKIILNTFLSNVEHAKCLVETRIHQMSKKRQFPVSVGVSRQQNLCIGSRKIGGAMGLLSVWGSLLSEVRWSLKPWSQSIQLRHKAKMWAPQTKAVSQFYKTFSLRTKFGCFVRCWRY